MQEFKFEFFFKYIYINRNSKTANNLIIQKKNIMIMKYDNEKSQRKIEETYLEKQLRRTK